jgi:hypothetical protein
MAENGYYGVHEKLAERYGRAGDALYTFIACVPALAFAPRCPVLSCEGSSLVEAYSSGQGTLTAPRPAHAAQQALARLARVGSRSVAGERPAAL